MLWAPYDSLSFLVFVPSSPRIVAISFCINAHGTVEPANGHFSPLGQYTWGRGKEIKIILVGLVCHCH